jgi:hypothetical protein
MRDLKTEQKVTNGWLITIGLLFIAGLVSIAVGTEIMILELVSFVEFWIWQGVWFIVVAFVLGIIFNLSKRN